MKNSLFLLIGLMLVAPAAKAQVAKSIGCSAYIASDDSSNDLKNAPALELKWQANAVGGNDFTGTIQRGNTDYVILVETQADAFDPNNKAVIKTSIYKTLNRGKTKLTPVKTEGGYDNGFKVYYGENDLLVFCAEPVI